MSAGHLLFAGVSTLYVLVALRSEERDLVKFHGDEYREYRRRTPPRPYRRPGQPPAGHVRTSVG